MRPSFCVLGVYGHLQLGDRTIRRGQFVAGQFVAGQFVADNSSRTIRRGQFVAKYFFISLVLHESTKRIYTTTTVKVEHIGLHCQASHNI